VTIRLVLADHHPIVLDGLTALFAREPDIQVQACCTSGEQALRAAMDHRPDVLLLDNGLPDMNGIDVLQKLRSHASPTHVVLFADTITVAQATAALRLGADGILLKEVPSRLVVNCVRKVHGGGRWIETGSVSRAFDRLVGGKAGGGEPLEKISAREREIIRLVVTGLSNKQIAARLFLSEGTVKSHLHHIYGKLDVHTRLQLAAYSQDNDPL